LSQGAADGAVEGWVQGMGKGGAWEGVYRRGDVEAAKGCLREKVADMRRIGGMMSGHRKVWLADAIHLADHHIAQVPSTSRSHLTTVLPEVGNGTAADWRDTLQE